MSELAPSHRNPIGSGVSAVIVSSLCGSSVVEPALDFFEEHFHFADGASIFPMASLGAFILGLLLAVLVWLACNVWQARPFERPAMGWAPAIILSASGVVPGVLAGAACLEVFRDQLQSFAIPGFVCFAVILGIADAILRWRPPSERQNQQQAKPNIATYPFDD